MFKKIIHILLLLIPTIFGTEMTNIQPEKEKSAYKMTIKKDGIVMQEKPSIPEWTTILTMDGELTTYTNLLKKSDIIDNYINGNDKPHIYKSHGGIDYHTLVYDMLNNTKDEVQRWMQSCVLNGICIYLKNKHAREVGICHLCQKYLLNKPAVDKMKNDNKNLETYLINQILKTEFLDSRNIQEMLKEIVDENTKKDEDYRNDKSRISQTKFKKLLSDSNFVERLTIHPYFRLTLDYIYDKNMEDSQPLITKSRSTDRRMNSGLDAGQYDKLDLSIKNFDDL